MRLTIFIYKGTPLVDFAIPYDILKDIPGIEICIASHEAQEISFYNDEFKIGNFMPLASIEETDILWLCGSENIDGLVGEVDLFQADLKRLMAGAQSVVAIAEGVWLLTALAELSGVEITCPASLKKAAKRAGARVKKDLLVLDGKYITVESHAHNFELAFTVGNLLQTGEAHVDLRAEWLYEPEYLFGEKDLPLTGFKANRLYAYLNKQWKDNRYRHIKLKTASSKYEPSTVEGMYDVTFYVFSNMRGIDFAITYEIIRHYPGVRIRCVSDARGPIVVEGGGYALVTTHAIQDVTKTQLLVISGGEEGVISELNHGYLVHWLERICERAQRVLTLCDGVRYLGVSGILTRYESYIDLSQPIHQGKYMIAATLTQAMDALIVIARDKYGKRIAKALQRYVAYGYFQNNNARGEQ